MLAIVSGCKHLADLRQPYMAAGFKSPTISWDIWKDVGTFDRDLPGQIYSLEIILSLTPMTLFEL